MSVKTFTFHYKLSTNEFTEFRASFFANLWFTIVPEIISCIKSNKSPSLTDPNKKSLRVKLKTHRFYNGKLISLNTNLTIIKFSKEDIKILSDFYGSQVYSKCNYVLLDGNIFTKLNQIKNVKRNKKKYTQIFNNLSQRKLRIKFITSIQENQFTANAVSKFDKKQQKEENKQNKKAQEILNNISELNEKYQMKIFAKLSISLNIDILKRLLLKTCLSDVGLAMLCAEQKRNDYYLSDLFDSIFDGNSTVNIEDIVNTHNGSVSTWCSKNKNWNGYINKLQCIIDRDDFERVTIQRINLIRGFLTNCELSDFMETIRRNADNVRNAFLIDNNEQNENIVRNELYKAINTDNMSINNQLLALREKVNVTAGKDCHGAFIGGKHNRSDIKIYGKSNENIVTAHVEMKYEDEDKIQNTKKGYLNKIKKITTYPLEHHINILINISKDFKSFFWWDSLNGEQ